MKSFLASLALAFVYLTAPALATDWNTDTNAINKTISDTNFIVEGHCTGTLIDAKLRFVLTNFHCIADAFDTSGTKQALPPEVWQTRTDNYDTIGRNVMLTDIVAFNKDKDVAVLQIRDQSLKWVPTPSIQYQVVRGEDVWIVGNPNMLEASVVKGIVSNRTRTMELGGVKHDYLQFSGGIIGGNSGGALYNRYGQLVAIPSAGFVNATFLGFGIPMSVVSEVLKDACIGFDNAGKVTPLTKCPGGPKFTK